MDQQRDEKLWRIARKRASFKRSLSVYFIIIGFLWVIWWFSNGRHGNNMSWPWPLWAMLGWGLALAFQYFEAYNGDKETLAEKEYERLKQEQGK